MDFIWSTDPNAYQSTLNALHLITREQPYLSAFGPWGSLCATRTRYPGLEAIDEDEAFTLVGGDPLVSPWIGETQTENAPGYRTRRLARFWRSQRLPPSTFFPSHPGLLVRIDKTDGQLMAIVDYLGAVPIYYAQRGDHRYVATSPDLLACVLRPSLDLVSAAELFTTERIAFPHTLFREVEQLAPASTHTITKARANVCSRYWLPPLIDPGLSKQFAPKILEAFDAVLARVAKHITHKNRPAIALLSAGMDTRAVLSRAHQIFDIEALTLTPSWNREAAIARRVARIEGVKHHHVKWDVQLFKERFLGMAGRAGTQNSWDDTHLFSVHRDFLPDASAYIGGYAADTLLSSGATSVLSRNHSIQNGSLAPSSPGWATDGTYHALLPTTIRMIEERHEAAYSRLGIDGHENVEMRDLYPLTRFATSAHFQSSIRQAPQYEPFLGKEMVELAFSLSSRRKSPATKSAPFKENLSKFSSVKSNPGPDRIDMAIRWMFSNLGLPFRLQPLRSVTHQTWFPPNVVMRDSDFAQQIRGSALAGRHILQLQPGEHSFGGFRKEVLLCQIAWAEKLCC